MSMILYCSRKWNILHTYPLWADVPLFRSPIFFSVCNHGREFKLWANCLHNKTSKFFEVGIFHGGKILHKLVTGYLNLFTKSNNFGIEHDIFLWTSIACEEVGCYALLAFLKVTPEKTSSIEKTKAIHCAAVAPLLGCCLNECSMYTVRETSLIL